MGAVTEEQRTYQDRAGVSGAPPAPMASPPWRTLVGRLLSLFVPILGAQSLIGFLELTDAALMRDLGGHSFAAGSLAVSVAVTARVACSAMLSVVSPAVARARACGRDARELALLAGGSAALLGAAVAIGVACGFAFWRPAALPVATRGASEEFVRILCIGLPFTLLFTVSRHVVAGLARPGRSLRWMMVAVPVNAGLDVALSRGIGGYRGLGLSGIAWSTVVVEVFLAVVAWVDLLRLLPPSVPGATPRRRAEFSIAALARQGAPLAAAAGLEVGVFQLSGIVVAARGVAELADHQALLTIAGFAAVIPVSLAMATSIQTAEIAAAGGSARIGYQGVLVVTSVIGMILAGSAILAGEHVLAAFLSPGSAPWLLAAQAGPALALLLVADTWQGAIVGILRGMRDTMFVGRAALGCLGVGAGGAIAVLLAYRGTLAAVWYALAAATVLMACVLWWRLWWRARHRMDAGS